MRFCAYLDIVPFPPWADENISNSLGNRRDKRVWEDCGAEGRCVAPRRYLNPASVIKSAPARGDNTWCRQADITTLRYPVSGVEFGEFVEDPHLVASNGTRARERGVPVKELTKTSSRVHKRQPRVLASRQGSRTKDCNDTNKRQVRKVADVMLGMGKGVADKV
ncbi:hypothetical protein B0T18DRAFT_390113 [Schizothecium vesticola]|uniref:Uncharacterized protein n=1 Tax=Schizothecium vesticola TaxID=314040 RepID=A0AA40K4F0_9PEZI|nr:hypothetical protein B0T18DRAFT_390113 [Schizothecium vesticola]